MDFDLASGSSMVIGRFSTSEELESLLFSGVSFSGCRLEKRLLRFEASPLVMGFLLGDIPSSPDEQRRDEDVEE